MHVKLERRCVACRLVKQYNDMIRVSKLDNVFRLDNNHKLGGRGAYVCKDRACIDKTIKKRLLNRSFKMNVDESIYKELEEYEQNN